MLFRWGEAYREKVQLNLPLLTLKVGTEVDVALLENRRLRRGGDLLLRHVLGHLARVPDVCRTSLSVFGGAGFSARARCEPRGRGGRWYLACGRERRGRWRLHHQASVRIVEGVKAMSASPTLGTILRHVLREQNVDGGGLGELLFTADLLERGGGDPGETCPAEGGREEGHCVGVVGDAAGERCGGGGR